jgi:hypothetical protein
MLSLQHDQLLPQTKLFCDEQRLWLENGHNGQGQQLQYLRPAVIVPARALRRQLINAIK